MNTLWKYSKGTKTNQRTVKTYGLNEAILTMNFSTRNSIFSLTNLDGRVLYSCSCGLIGYKNSNKKTPIAAEEVVKKVLSQASSKGIKTLGLKLRGFGMGRNSALRFLSNTTMNFSYIEDRTYIKFGGCRSRKLKKK